MQLENRIEKSWNSVMEINIYGVFMFELKEKKINYNRKTLHSTI